MVWKMETSCGFESDKIAALTVPYLQGKALDIGCGQRKVWDSLIGVDSCKDYNGNRPPSVDIVGEGHELSMFTDECMDGVFSSHLLEHFFEERVVDILAEWARVLKPGGFLVLYLPSANLYPKRGESGANPDHKWDIYPGDIEKKLRQTMEKISGLGWTQVECEERSQYNEYSLFEVYQKRSDGQFVKNVWARNPDGKKRALVVRYGAIGDAIMCSTILPLLKQQGYHITFQCAPGTYEILKHDPHVDVFEVQEKDFVPNLALGAYWETIRGSGRYDEIINLCESIEGGLLPMPGKLPFFYSQDVRRQMYGTVNYLERHHEIAGLPMEINARYYPTESELEAARKLLPEKGPVIVWALNGSAPHKVYPWINIVAAWIIKRTPAHLFLLADPGIGKELQNAIVKTMLEDGADMSRVHPMAGRLQIREALALAFVADLVVGPETGTLNAVGMEDTAKVIYLSHSSEQNLTKYWKNCTVLKPDAERAPCFPCHRLHYNWEYCPQDKASGAALCAAGIEPGSVFKAIIDALVKQEKLKKAA